MQQTSKYQFKLIEGTDSFSPDPLNENMEMVEEQFESVEESIAGVLSAMGSHGKTARIQWGSYTGDGQYGASHPTSLSFGFTPAAVFLACADDIYSRPTVLLRSMSTLPGPGGNFAISLTWSGSGLSWYSTYDASAQGSSDGVTYYYVAVGYEAE